MIIYIARYLTDRARGEHTALYKTMSTYKYNNNNNNNNNNDNKNEELLHSSRGIQTGGSSPFKLKVSHRPMRYYAVGRKSHIYRNIMQFNKIDT